MSELISWYTLWIKIGKQPLKNTMHQYVKCCIDNQMWYCQLVYTNSGTKFHLEPVILVENYETNKNS